jgi:hypothetical protein
MLSVWKRGIQTNPNPRETSLGAGSRFPKNDDCGAASIPPPKSIIIPRLTSWKTRAKTTENKGEQKSIREFIDVKLLPSSQQSRPIHHPP